MRMLHKGTAIAIGTMAISLHISGSALAALTASSPLLDPPGTQFNNNTIAANETGWDGVGFATKSESDAFPLNITAGSLSYTDANGNTLATSGNKATFQSIGDNDTDNDNTLARYFPTEDYSDGSFWFSALVQPETLMQILLIDNDGQTITFNLGGQPDVFTVGANSLNFGPALTKGETCLIVAHYRRVGDNAGADDQIEVWINPEIGGTAPANAEANTTVNLTTFFNGAGDLAQITELRILSNLDGEGTLDSFDEVRLGETFADVTPVPEPASGALIGIGAMLALSRRR